VARLGTRWQGTAAAAAAVVAVLAAYAPVLRLPPVAEDVQWAVRGATVRRSPELLLRPFHQHFRPLGDAYFAGCAAAFGDRWPGYRAVQLGIAGALTLAGWALARRLLGGAGGAAALVAGLWLVCPLVSDVFCVTNQVKQMMLGIGLFGVLVLRSGPASGRRRAAVVVCSVAAAAAKEEWVVAPALVLLQDLVWLGQPWRVALRRALPWTAAVAAYLTGYAVLTGFAASSFYDASAADVAAKAAATLTSMWHLADPVPLGFTAFVREHPAGAATAVALTGAVVAALAAWRCRTGLFAAAAAVVLAAPTALSTGQAGRYLLLPWLCALLAVAVCGREAWRRQRLRVAVAAGAVALVAAAAARDLPAVRGDIDDWARYAALQRAVELEAGPLLEAARAGQTLVVLRGDDGGPLAMLVATPAGQAKLYFMRPDDPYGAVALQAVLTWKLRREGLAVERVRRPDPGARVAAYIHRAGGFIALERVPDVPVRHPADPSQGVPGVVLEPAPWSSFVPAAFP
jgi:hypothetical protein